MSPAPVLQQNLPLLFMAVALRAIYSPPTANSLEPLRSCSVTSSS
jgi:hypothetical protein